MEVVLSLPTYNKPMKTDVRKERDRRLLGC
jgi:hypothetical protein